MRPILFFFVCLLTTGQLAAQPCNLQVTATVPGGQPCRGDTLFLFANASPANASYFWSGPAGFSSTLQNPVLYNIDFPQDGTYTVTAISGNCYATDDVFVQAHNVPFFTPVFDSVVCEGDTLTIKAFVFGTGNQFSYVFDLDGNAYNAYYINPSVTLNDAGIYKAVAFTTQCVSDTVEIPVAVKPSVPTAANIVADNDNPSPGTTVTFTATVTPVGANPVISWYKNNQVIPGATGLNYSAVVGTGIKQGDSIKAQAIADVMCGIPGYSNTIGVKVNLSVNDISSNNISLYPNPTNGTLTIRNDIAVGKPVNITVLNAIGQVMQQMEMKASTDVQFQLSDKLPSGIYLLQVKTGGAVFIARFRLDR